MNTTTAAATVIARVHPFEKHGLGKAPFRCVGVETKVGPIRTTGADGIVTIIGSPGQPMGVCDYCGTCLVNCFQIVSADGKRFIVGCDCVLKTTTVGTVLRTEVEVQFKALRKAADEERVRKAMALLDNDVEGKVLRAFFGAKQMDYIDFCRKHAGVSGMLKICRMIDKALKQIEETQQAIASGRLAATECPWVAEAAAPAAPKALCDREDFPF